MQMQKRYLFPGIFGIVLFLSVVVAPVALAFESRGGDQVIIEANEVIEDDLYVGANRLVINGTVKGDVLAGATQIEVNGKIEGDLMAGAQTIVINGEVTDDVRVGAAVLTIGETGKIGDDLLAGGYSIEAKAGSVIGGNVMGGSGQSTLNGSVGGDVNLGAGGLVINGAIAGNVETDVGAPGQTPPFNPFLFMPNAPVVTPIAPGLFIGPNAIISGNLTYRTSASATIPADVVKGAVTFNQVAQTTPENPLAPVSLQKRGIQAAQYWVALLILGLVFIAVARRLMRGAADALGAKPGGSFLWGFVAFIVFPIALLIVLGILIALGVALNAAGLGEIASTILVAVIVTAVILGLLYVLALTLITKITVSYQLGRFITRSREGIFWPLFLGTLLVAILVWLPFAGTLVSSIITLFGLGALWLYWRGATEPSVKRDPYSLG